MKEIFLLAIRIYQATRLMRMPTCRFYPSCSDYAKQSIDAHGVLRGIAFALHRLSRCHPFSKGGTDFPPTPICHFDRLSTSEGVEKSRPSAQTVFIH